MASRSPRGRVTDMSSSLTKLLRLRTCFGSNKPENETCVNHGRRCGKPEGRVLGDKSDPGEVDEGGAEQGEEEPVAALGGDAEDAHARLVVGCELRQDAERDEGQRDEGEEQRGRQGPAHPGEGHDDLLRRIFAAEACIRMPSRMAPTPMTAETIAPGRWPRK